MGWVNASCVCDLGRTDVVALFDANGVIWWGASLVGGLDSANSESWLGVSCVGGPDSADDVGWLNVSYNSDKIGRSFIDITIPYKIVIITFTWIFRLLMLKL